MVLRRQKRYASTRVTQHVNILSTVWLGTDVFGALTFQLSDIPGYTNFTAVWDEYKFDSVQLKFIEPFNVNAISGYNVATGATTSVFVPPSLLTAADYTDASTPTQSILLTHEDCIIHGQMNTQKNVSLVPVPLGALYQGAFTGYGREDNQWVECNSAGVVHYGLKYGVVKGSNVPNINFPVVVWATYNLHFRKIVG
jgi:hypothetical protein